MVIEPMGLAKNSFFGETASRATALTSTDFELALRLQERQERLWSELMVLPLLTPIPVAKQTGQYNV